MILIRLLTTSRCGNISRRKPRLDGARSVALGRSSVARHRGYNCTATGNARKGKSQVCILVGILSTDRSVNNSMKEPLFNEDRGVAKERNSLARSRWPHAQIEVTVAKKDLRKKQQLVLHQGLHIPGCSGCKRSEKREEKKDVKKGPTENPNLAQSKVCWPLGRVESLHFCGVGGLEAS